MDKWWQCAQSDWIPEEGRATVLAEQGLDSAVTLRGLKADPACSNTEAAVSVAALLTTSSLSSPAWGKCYTEEIRRLATVKPRGIAARTLKKCRAFPVYRATG